MKINGIPWYNEYNLPLLVFVIVLCLYLWKIGHIECLFVVIPLVYIFRESLSKLYINEVFPKNMRPTNHKENKPNRQNRQKREITTTQLKDIVSKLRPYRKYSNHNFRKGTHYLKMFEKMLDYISRDRGYNTKQFLQNAEEYMRHSLNHFQAMSFSVPEQNYTKILDYDKSVSSKIRQRIGNSCKQLYRECYRRLFNYATLYDVEFRKNPTIYSGEFGYASQYVGETNRYSPHELH